MTEQLDQYAWMVALAIVVGFIMAFGIGANDVANAFASSVSSKSLSLGQAIVVASVFEFLGAVLLGQSVGSTIRGKIIDPSYYEDQPEIMMFGMLSALIVASVWLLTATSFELPVSTTHTIVAGIIGFSLVAEGFESVDWNTATKIFISWFVSPTLTGFISFIFFSLVNRIVLNKADTLQRALKFFPIVIFIGIAVNVSFIMLKSKKKIFEHGKIDHYGMKFVLPISLGSGLLCGLVFWLFVGPWLQKKVESEQQEHEKAIALEDQEKETDEDQDSHTGSGPASEDVESLEQAPEQSPEEEAGLDKDESKGVGVDAGGDGVIGSAQKADLKNVMRDMYNGLASSLRAAWQKFGEKTYKQDIHEMSLSESKQAREIWETYMQTSDPHTERLFSYLQVFTACLTSFAHGSNDIANAIAALSAVFDIYKYGELRPKAEVEKWMLAMGGAAISLGFTLYGYKIIKAVGFKLTCMTPSRGFCIQLATALAVSLASFLQLPVSSTQCLVGATIGAGVAAGGHKQVQWPYFLRVCLGWVVTFFVTCASASGFFAFCVYSPSLDN